MYTRLSKVVYLEILNEDKDFFYCINLFAFSLIPGIAFAAIFLLAWLDKYWITCSCFVTMIDIFYT